MEEERGRGMNLYKEESKALFLFQKTIIAIAFNYMGVVWWVGPTAYPLPDGLLGDDCTVFCRCGGRIRSSV